MKKALLIFVVAFIGLMGAILWSTSSAEDAELQISTSEDFIGSSDYQIFEDTGNSKVVFVYSDPTEHHPGG